MEILTVILIAIVIGTLNIVCFFVGAKVGQKVSKDEPIEMPTINPFEAYRKAQNKAEADREQDEYETLMHNIECYDGTGKGQKDVR